MALCATLYTDQECQDIDYIITHESGWVVGRPNSEGCAGLAQACPASKLGSAYGNLEGELKWAYNYGIAVYHSIANARAVWQRQHWW